MTVLDSAQQSALQRTYVHNIHPDPVVHPATWLGHQAKGLIGLGFETSAGKGRGVFSNLPNGYLPPRGVNTQIWPTPSNKPSPA